MFVNSMNTDQKMLLHCGSPTYFKFKINHKEKSYTETKVVRLFSLSQVSFYPY